MVDLKILAARGITPEKLREKLQGDPAGKSPEKAMAPRIGTNPEEDGRELDDFKKRTAMLNRIRSRVQEAMSRNLNDYKHYYALDLAWDVPFRQITPTMVSTFLDSDPNDAQIYKALSDWGMTHLITEKPDPKTPGKNQKTLNLPTFFKVFVPLVKTYVTIRWAKIMNDRRLTPFFKYEPAKMTTELSLKCGVITDRIQVMANQYGYFDVMKQSVLKMLHYSFCFQFPKEEWHSEEQLRIATETDVSNGAKKASSESTENPEGVPAAVGDEIKITSKEGIRYHHPHPTRTYWDIGHGAYTLNHDCGAEYSGFWQIVRYRDVLNGAFWNLDKIALGSMDIIGENPAFFQTVYSACTMKYPVAVQLKAPDGAVGASVAGIGTGPLDREKQIGSLYYGTEYLDQGVLITNHFEKLIPKDNGLGDYEYPVWFKFVLAGDGCTVLYATPLPYPPTIYYGYDADESRLKNASMSLEVLPFQDQFANILTQIILTAKQNLANFTMVDEDQLTDQAKKEIQNIGESYHRFLNIFGFSGKKAARGQNKIPDVAHSVSLPKGNTAELINVLKTILDVLERVLVMSSQEVAQAASHEQTREEIRNIQSSTSSRLVFTAIPVDIARDAWKRQLYLGWMAYGDVNMTAHIPTDVPVSKEDLATMGFTFNDKGVDDGKELHGPNANNRIRYRRATIKKEQTAIELWELASTRDGEDRTDKKQQAAELATILDKILTNPMTAQAIGPEQAIDFINALIQMTDLPRDLKFRNMTPKQASDGQPDQGAAQGADQQQGSPQDQLKQVVGIVLSQVKGELDPLLQETTRNSKDIALVMQTLNIQAQNPNADSTATETVTGSPS